MLDDTLFVAVVRDRAAQAQWLNIHGWKIPSVSHGRSAARKRLASLLLVFARWLDPPIPTAAPDSRFPSLTNLSP